LTVCNDFIYGLCVFLSKIYCTEEHLQRKEEYYLCFVIINMESNFEISTILPGLNREKVAEVMQRLKDCGVNNKSDLCLITAEDLTQDRLLTKIQARRLVNRWKNQTENSGLLIVYFYFQQQK